MDNNHFFITFGASNDIYCFLQCTLSEQLCLVPAQMIRDVNYVRLGILTRR